MNALPRLYLLLALIAPFTYAESFSIMTFNAQNLFDTLDDEGKDDKAYLPLELKQNEEHQRSCSNINVKAWRNECFFLDWNKETKDAKLKILANNIITYNDGGADLMATLIISFLIAQIKEGSTLHLYQDTSSLTHLFITLASHQNLLPMIQDLYLK
jgi:hypothetical protein